jgi:hypothetical protein
VLRAALPLIAACSFTHGSGWNGAGDAPPMMGGGSDAQKPPDAGLDAAPAVGMLTGSGTLLGNTTIDLSSEGTADWAEWGMTSATDFNHMASNGGKIANVTAINTTTIYGYGNNYMQAGNDGFTWTGGTPTAMTTSAQYSGVFTRGMGAGLSTTVPASSTRSYTLKLYVGGYYATGTLTAHLSDGSAPDYVDGNLGSQNASYDGAYTLVYRSATPGATLTVSWVQSSFNNDVNWSAATLQ